MFLHQCRAAECEGGFLLCSMHCSSGIASCMLKWWLTLKPQVQSGGQFEIDYEVVGPNDRIILRDTKERQGDFVFTAQNAGEYRFCFSNEGYTASDKMVDFEIAVRQPPCHLWPLSPPTACSHVYTPCLTHSLYRSKTNPGPPCFLKRPAQPLNRPPRWKTRSSKSVANSARSAACRNTSVQERTGTSARSGVRKTESSISVWSK